MLLRPRAATLTLLGGTVLFACSDLLRRLVIPDSSAGPVTVVRLVHDHLGTWTVAAALALLSALVLLAGLAAVAALAPGRGRPLATIGQAVFGVGVIASVAHAVGEFGVPATQARSGVGSAAVNAMDKAGFWPWDVAVLLFIAGFLLGPVLLLAGLRRARVVPVWSPVAAIVAGVCGGTSGVVAGWIGLAAWVVAFVPVALAGLRHDGGHESRTGATRSADPALAAHEFRAGAI